MRVIDDSFCVVGNQKKMLCRVPADDILALNYWDSMIRNFFR